MEGYNKRYNIYVTEGLKKRTKRGGMKKLLKKKWLKTFQIWQKT